MPQQLSCHAGRVPDVRPRSDEGATSYKDGSRRARRNTSRAGPTPPAYHDLAVETLRGFRAVVASNGFHKQQMDPFNENVRVIPGGVDVASFACEPPVDAARKIILMTGRAEDPAKGMQTLYDAGERLAATRSDFEIRVTHSDYAIGQRLVQGDRLARSRRHHPLVSGIEHLRLPRRCGKSRSAWWPSKPWRPGVPCARAG